MQFENRVKKLLAQGRAAWGAGLSEASDLFAKLAIDTGIDFLWLDNEHTSFSPQDFKWIPILGRMKGCVTLVRVAGLDSNLIKKTLDVGADAIMVPQISTAEDARRAVEFCKYPPEGSRGAPPMWPFFLNVDLNEYLPQANQETMVVVEIETKQGLDNLEEIAAVDGVDVLFAGPLDLSAVLGHIGQVDHPEVQECLAEIPRRVAACGKTSGITVQGLDACRKVYDQGYRFIAYGNLAYLGTIGLQRDLEALRKYELKPSMTKAMTRV